MKIKTASVLIILLMLISAVQVVAIDNGKESFTICTKTEQIGFNEIKINEKNDFLTVDLFSANSEIFSAGRPKLPVYKKTYIFPLNTKIKNIECAFSDTEEININRKIEPAENPIPKTNLKCEKREEILDKSIYSSEDLFPKKSYDYKISIGIKDKKNVVILDVYLYPVRYSPLKNKLFYSKNFELSVSYQQSFDALKSADEYDMVIICSNSFENQAKKLADHKNNIGIKTKVKTTNSIYIDSNLEKYDAVGRDRPEKIKYFIKWARENWGIDHVLLMGGRIGQLLNFWHVPIRYTNLNADFWEKGFISDLYFSDIYKYNETKETYEFDDWDSNGNDIFAEWRYVKNDESEWVLYKDELDLYPDVYIGRLACRNKKEARIVVDKIINYEKNTYNKDFFNNFIIVGGDTVPPADDGLKGLYEGEIETDLAANHLEEVGFKRTELWASTGNLTSASDVVREINQGAGFIFLSGHGNPMSYATHPPDAEEEGEWIDGLYNFDMKLLENKNKLPVCVIGACHSNQFDVSILNFFKGLIHERLNYFDTEDIDMDSGSFWKYEWWPRCWGWNMVRQKNGGSIATIGNAGLGYGGYNEKCTERLDGWITTTFFKNYKNFTMNLGRANFSIGDVHSKTISDYVSYYRNNPSPEYAEWEDIKTVEGWTLLGDPSLKIGGVKNN